MDNTARLDSELPNKMASLDLWEPGQSIEETVSSSSTPAIQSRSLRKRMTPDIVANRRVTTKPRKRLIKELSSDTEIKNYYCNQKVRVLSQTLETIFEEPKTVSNGSAVLIGIKKIKRSLTFPLGPTHTKDKIKKRRSKIKRLLGNKNFTNRKKLTMQTFMKNLQGLESDESNTLTDKINLDVTSNT